MSFVRAAPVRILGKVIGVGSFDPIIVILGGAMGGLLLKLLSRLHVRLQILSGLAWFKALALGSATAWLSGFAFGYASIKDVTDMFFLSVLSGWAFPILLVAAIDTALSQVSRAPE